MKKELASQLYQRMFCIRSFEEAVLDLFQKGVLKGTTHVCIGQEAVAVGTCSQLQADDYVVSTHRGHGHYLAKGGDCKKLMAEVFGKESGCCGGRGGSQHIMDLDIGFLGANGITGGGIPLATGAGFSIKYRRTAQVVVAFFGDGASNQGTFHESLNIAALWNLPVIYVCENNLYAMSTPLCASTANGSIAERGKSYGIHSEKIEGNDIQSVVSTVKTAIARARKKQGPSLIEMSTYRHKGHSKSDQCHYRTREEETQWKERCPIKSLERFFVKEDILDARDIDAIQTQVKREIEESIRFAQEAKEPRFS